MKIESFLCVGTFGQYIPMSFPTEFEFHSIHEVASRVFDTLLVPNNIISSVMVWLDNQRYLYISRDSYIVTYYQHFNKQQNEPSTF